MRAERVCGWVAQALTSSPVASVLPYGLPWVDIAEVLGAPRPSTPGWDSPDSSMPSVSQHRVSQQLQAFTVHRKT